MNPITLRRYLISQDGEFLWAMWRQERSREFFRRCPPGWTKEDVFRFEELMQCQLYMVCDGEWRMGLAIIAHICNYGLNCQVGLILDETLENQKFEGFGYGFYAMHALAKMIFEKSTIRKMSFRFLKKRKDIENSLKRAGMRKEGDFKENVKFRGAWEDELEYAISEKLYLKKYKDLFR